MDLDHLAGINRKAGAVRTSTKRPMSNSTRLGVDHDGTPDSANHVTEVEFVAADHFDN